MSYQPYNRNTSGIVFFGEQGSQQTYYSDSNFLIEDGAAGNIQAPNLKISDGGNIGSVSDPDAIAIASNGNITLSQSLSIAGNLTVNGTTTTVNSTVTTIEDPVIIIGSGAGAGYGGETDDNKDRGIAFAWNNNGAGNGQLGFFGHDDSIQRFVYYTSGTITNDVMGDVQLGDAEFRWGKFVGVSGALAGTATEATNVTVTANNTTNETVYLTFVDGATGTQGIETDTALSYNPSTDTLTAGTFNGNLTGNVTGSADTLTNSRYIGASGHAVGSGLFDGSADQVPNIELTNVAIIGQTEKSSAAVSADYILLADSEDSDNIKKISRSNFLTGVGAGTMESWGLTDGTTLRTVGDGDSVEFLSDGTIDWTTGAGSDTVHLISGVVNTNSIDESHLTTSVAGDGLTGGNNTALAVNTGAGLEINTDAVRIATTAAGNGLTGGGGSALAIDISEYSTVAVAASDSFMVLDSDGSTHQRATIDQLGTYLAGTNITNTAGVLSVPDATIDGVVFEAANFVDGTTIDFTVTAGTSVTAEVVDSTITEGKRFRDVQAVTATTDTITGDIVTVDAATAGGNVTLTLPSHSEGRIIHIKKIDSGSNTVSTSTVDGGTLTLYSQNESATIFSTGSAWYII